MVLPHLKVVQETHQPNDDPSGIGKPGRKSNRLYRKALSTPASGLPPVLWKPGVEIDPTRFLTKA